jgi:hypothetical protein
MAGKPANTAKCRSAIFPFSPAHPSRLAWNMRIFGQMDPHRYDATTAGLAAQLAGLSLPISLFVSTVRGALANPGFLAICFLISVVVVLIVVGICRQIIRARKSTENPFALPAASADPTWSNDATDGIPDFLHPMLRRRYPWRH